MVSPCLCRAPHALLRVGHKCLYPVLLSMHDEAGRGCCVPIQGSQLPAAEQILSRIMQTGAL
jgi:hypothetical protein